MEGKYQKIIVPMKRESDNYRFWKQEEKLPVCYVESYKEKSAVFFRDVNLLPGIEYHLLLIGGGEGSSSHQDFGPFHARGNGELECYRIFSGAPIETYAYCLLCAEDADGQPEIVYKGNIGEVRRTPWDALCKNERKVVAFTERKDETDACWYRIEDLETLPLEAVACLPWIRNYEHYIIGRKESRYFLGVPGRFLQKEQPLRDEGVFLLWQPIRGGEDFYDCPGNMSRREQEDIFGYWIAEIDINKEKFRAV